MSMGGPQAHAKLLPYGIKEGLPVIRPESPGFWANNFAYSKFVVARSLEHRPLFRPRSLALGFERGNPCSRCHSKSLPEKFDEGARLPIADLGRNRFYRTPATSSSIPFIIRICLRQNSKLVPTSLRKVLWSVLTLTPTVLHSASSDGASAWFAMKASATPSALESSGSLTNVGTDEAFRNWDKMRSRRAR
jgi:hypothetical protein